ncbi:hypothetical protein TrispH2_001909 [Trichoplax sp. H2]|nr:hypothetical protein TrispH2_001909 [Trichoplax sp. H2]|eukprot:RDD45915.1 hypothetical protein TrispH2_001909 [Trichoplax sp. H2]
MNVSPKRIETFKWSLAPVSHNDVIKASSVKDEKYHQALLIINVNDSLYIGTPTQLLLICKFPDVIQAFSILNTGLQVLLVNDTNGKLWSISYDILMDKIDNAGKRKRTDMDANNDGQHNPIARYHHPVQWDSTGLPKEHQRNDNIKILTVAELDAKIILSTNCSVNTIFFHQYWATYGAITNPYLLKIFQIMPSMEKNSVYLQFITDTELIDNSKKDENSATDLVVQSFYPSDFKEMCYGNCINCKIDRSLFINIFGLDAMLAKSYGFMYGSIDGKIRIYSCNMQNFPKTAEIFYDLCEEPKAITSVRIPITNVNGNQSVVNNAILLLGIQGKLIIACRGIIGNDTIGLVFRQYNLFGPVTSQCLFQDEHGTSSLLYASTNDLRLVRFNSNTETTAISHNESNKSDNTDEDAEKFKNQLDSLPVLPQVLHPVSERIDHILSILPFICENEKDVGFVAIKSTGQIIKFGLSIFMKKSNLEKSDLNPQLEISKRLNQLTNLNNLKTELVSAISACNNRIKFFNNIAYQYHRINRCKQLNDFQLKIGIHVEYNSFDSLSNQSGTLVIRMIDDIGLINSSYSLLVLVSGYTHRSGKLCKDIASFSYPLRDRPPTRMTFNIPFKRLLGNVITLSGYSEINFNILFTLTVECLLCLNSSVTSNGGDSSQFLKKGSHKMLKLSSCITISQRIIDSLYFVTGSFIGRKPPLKLMHQRLGMNMYDLIPISMNFEGTMMLLKRILYDKKNYNPVPNVSESNITNQVEWKNISLQIKLITNEPVDLPTFRDQILHNILNKNSDCINHYDQEANEISLVFFDELQVAIRIILEKSNSEIPSDEENRGNNSQVISSITLHISSMSVPTLLSVYCAISRRLQEILRASFQKPFTLSTEITKFNRRMLQADLHNIRDQVCRLNYLSSIEEELLQSTKLLSVMSCITDLQIKIGNITTIVASEI